MHEVELTGLTANTTYVYQISAGGNWSEEARFTTAGDGDFEFIHVTDSQSTNVIGYEVFNRDLTTALNNSNANFIAHTGDIVEDNGTSDEFWRGFFAKAQTNFLNNALVCTPGNNDLTELPDGTFNLDNYAKHFKFANRSSITPHSYTFEYGQAFFVCIDYTQKLEEQKAWIREQLAGTNKKWKIVLIHAAPYTSFKENTFLFAEVFEETNVDLVLCGHKHMYMRSYPMKNDAKVNPGEGPVYIMGNSMGVKQNKLDNEQPWMEVRLAPMVSCYNNIKVTESSIEFVANKIVNNVVEEIDNITLTK
jgi:predicted phosphodiesterase